jgi:hypothetical protein
MFRFFTLLAATSFLGSTAVAQDDGRVKYKERTVIDFEGVDVTGDLVKPQGQLLLERKRANFNPLIRLRTDFNVEMKRSIDQVK